MGSRVLRRALLSIGVPESCARCGIGPLWNGVRLALHVDHINGDFGDNRPHNLGSCVRIATHKRRISLVVRIGPRIHWTHLRNAETSAGSPRTRASVDDARGGTRTLNALAGTAA